MTDKYCRNNGLSSEKSRSLPEILINRILIKQSRLYHTTVVNLVFYSNLQQRVKCSALIETTKTTNHRPFIRNQKPQAIHVKWPLHRRNSSKIWHHTVLYVQQIHYRVLPYWEFFLNTGITYNTKMLCIPTTETV